MVIYFQLPRPLQLLQQQKFPSWWEKSERGEGNGWQEQGRLGKLHLSCVWMCKCNNIRGVGHWLGCSCIEVGNSDDVWAFVLKL